MSVAISNVKSIILGINLLIESGKCIFTKLMTLIFLKQAAIAKDFGF